MFNINRKLICKCTSLFDVGSPYVPLVALVSVPIAFKASVMVVYGRNFDPSL